MNLTLANKLQELNVIREETKVTAAVTSRGIGGDPVRVSKELVLTGVNTPKFKGYNMREPNIFFSFTHEDITHVDGMDLERISKAFNLHEDGTPRKVGKKPGRKPKAEKV